MIDPISDMLARIRNAAAVKKAEVILPMSKLKYNVAKILEREGFLAGVEVLNQESVKNKTAAFAELRLVLKYQANGQSVITAINRISRPGRRVYSGKEKLPVVVNNFGIAIISTSAGLLTNKEARQKGLGGEVLCSIY
ncbi:30S ribosomal protein S8 [Candidatus Falkowbacteria bacterium]|jgi:small subunit ribosomal protein S8|nr:30S ribosomal protein S8 [Candidatus Falkowbacteria bacterium]